MNNFSDKSIILFDGVCNLCNYSVNFIIKHDKNNKFLFASLQSDAAKEILLQYNLNKNKLNTIILVKDETIYDRSKAVLLIAKELNGLIKYLGIFLFIPQKLRDFVYNVISKNRYKWFGKRTSCLTPSNELKNRFLE